PTLRIAVDVRSGIGASRPLRRIPAIVFFLNPQPALSLVGGKRSSCPRLCENSCVQFAPRKFFSFGQAENQSSGDGCSKRPIEKTVLRFLGSRTFSHGLAPFPPLLNTSSGIQSFMASAGGFRSNRKVPGGMFADHASNDDRIGDWHRSRS